jgi:hypothetical protein
LLGRFGCGLGFVLVTARYGYSQKRRE